MRNLQAFRTPICLQTQCVEHNANRTIFFDPGPVQSPYLVEETLGDCPEASFSLEEVMIMLHIIIFK